MIKAKVIGPNKVRAQWPEVFTSVPRKGEYIQSLCANVIIEVKSITHSVEKVYSDDWDQDDAPHEVVPIIIINDVDIST